MAETGPRDTVLEELRKAGVDTARTVHFVESTSEAASDGLRVLMHSDVQTDAIALMALLEVAPEDPMLPKVIAGILAERDPRRGGRWETTHANAWALLAASRYYETVEADEPDFVARDVARRRLRRRARLQGPQHGQGPAADPHGQLLQGAKSGP